MAFTMLMPVLGILSRAQNLMPDSSWPVVLMASIAPGVLGLSFFAITSRILRHLLTHRPAFLAVLLWSATGIFVGVSAAVIRSWIPGATVAVPLNSALIVLVTVGTMGLLTVGRDRLDRNDHQLKQALAQELRLERALEEQRQSGTEQLQALAREVEQIISPEIRRVEGVVTALGESSGSLRELSDDIHRLTSEMVRQASHDFAAGTFREPAAPVHPVRSNVMRWRGPGGIWDMVLSAHLTIGIIVIGGIYFIARYSSAGCVDLVSLAVAGFAVFGLLIYWISTIPRLRQRPWALILLVGGTAGGFVVMQFILGSNPECVPEYPMGTQVIDFLVSLSVLIALVVLFEAGRRARSDAVLLTRTNKDLAAATLRIQRSQAVTRSRIAQILHGGVQGRLSSMSLALRRFVDSEAAGEQPSFAELKKRLDYQFAQVREEVASLTSTSAFPRVDLESSIRQSVLQWRGLLVIHYNIDVRAADTLNANDYLSWAASEIIDAAITNANTHGEATNVWINVTVDSATATLLLSVEDDGSGPTEKVTPGMGLDGITALGGIWQMSPRVGAGCCLQIRLPLT